MCRKTVAVEHRRRSLSQGCAFNPGVWKLDSAVHWHGRDLRRAARCQAYLPKAWLLLCKADTRGEPARAEERRVGDPRKRVRSAPLEARCYALPARPWPQSSAPTRGFATKSLVRAVRARHVPENGRRRTPPKVAFARLRIQSRCLEARQRCSLART